MTTLISYQVHEWGVDAEGGEGAGDEERLHGPPPQADHHAAEVARLGPARRLPAVPALQRDLPPQALEEGKEEGMNQFISCYEFDKIFSQVE